MPRAQRPTKKKRPAKRKLTPEGIPDLTLTDMRKFHRSVDWAEWWEEFFTALNPNGTSYYKTFRHFAREKARNKEQRDFIEYIIGPPDLYEQIPDLWRLWKPMDWDERRATGGWYSDKSIRAITAQINEKHNALEAMRQVGNTITLRSLARFESLAQQLDREFRGRFFADGLSYADNLGRAQAYLALHRKIQMLQAQAQDMYAKAHGINFAMDNFETLMAGKVPAQIEAASTGVGRSVQKIVEMTLSKAATHDIPVPPAMETAIIEINKPNKPKVQ